MGGIMSGRRFDYSCFPLFDMTIGWGVVSIKTLTRFLRDELEMTALIRNSFSAFGRRLPHV
jgi:hypothetical protein